jgi:hypothetical protein
VHILAELAEELDGDRASEQRPRRQLAQERHADERHADGVEHLEDEDVVGREAE